VILTIISRFWKSKHNNEKYYLVYEKINLNEPTDPINGIYLFSSEARNVDTDNIGKDSCTIKIQDTSTPISNLEIDVHKSTIGIVWAAPLPTGGFRISLSKSFFDGPFITCSDHIDDTEAMEISDLRVDALERTIITFYTAKKNYQGKEIMVGTQAAHHAQPPPNPPLRPGLSPLPTKIQ
jgi:hypothetical protein